LFTFSNASKLRTVALGACVALSACAPRIVSPVSDAQPRVVHIFNVPFFPDNTDQCGPSSLASVLNFWGKTVTPDELRAEVYAPSLNGTLPMDLLPAVRNRGLVGQVVNGDFDVLKEELRAGRHETLLIKNPFG
jgi:hypothetical protein